MSGDPRLAVADISIESPAVAVVAALSVESRCLARRLRGRKPGGLTLHQCGPGAARAARVAAAAVERGAAALVSWGLAGGLDPAAAPGTIVLPRHVLTSRRGPSYHVDARWQARLVAALQPSFPVQQGSLLTSDEVLRGPEDKARAALETGAVAVDMESAGVAEAAAAAGVPFVALRVVADGPGDGLPAGVERWIDERGNRRLAPAVDAALRPAEWPLLLTLAQRYRAALRRLEAVAERLAPSGFLIRLDTP
jgi:adenosylhomocysteine nucleosidase